MKAATFPTTLLTKQGFAISIHAAREGGDKIARCCSFLFVISIHAAREGGDPLQRLLALKHVDFNPRRP